MLFKDKNKNEIEILKYATKDHTGITILDLMHQNLLDYEFFLQNKRRKIQGFSR